VCNRDLLGKRGYRAVIEVEEDRDPERGQESLYTLYHSQKPAVRIPKKLFPEKPGLGRKPRR
jgi:hypothetical protein